MAINIIEYNRSYKEELIEFILSIQKNEFNIKIDRDDQPDLENIEHNYLNNGGQFFKHIVTIHFYFIFIFKIH